MRIHLLNIVNVKNDVSRSQKMLTQELEQLSKKGLVSGKVYSKTITSERAQGAKNDVSRDQKIVRKELERLNKKGLVSGKVYSKPTTPERVQELKKETEETIRQAKKDEKSVQSGKWTKKVRPEPMVKTLPKEIQDMRVEDCFSPNDKKVEKIVSAYREMTVGELNDKHLSSLNPGSCNPNREFVIVNGEQCDVKQTLRDTMKQVKEKSQGPAIR